MAEFSKMMHEWRRLCKSYSGCVQCVLWSKCPTPSRDYWPIEDYVSIEKTIMAWAAEHPEPVYPTWGDWFVNRGMLPEKWDNLTSAYMDVGCVPKLIHSPIPADLAQKLGIEPKEGT